VSATALGALGDSGAHPQPARLILAGRIALGLALALLWQALNRWLGSAVVADLVDIARRLAEIAANGLLLRHAAITLWEAAAGLAIGAAAGLALPFVLRLLPRLEAALDPFIAAVMGVPKLALAPLLFLWFGIGRWLVAREVLFPTAVPFVLASLKVAAPRAISAAVVGEFVAAQAGLGFYINESMNQADTVGVFTGVIVVTVVVVAINALLERLQRRLLGWRELGLGGF
jgi:NitT/TauT family transport system permease protein